MAVEYSDLPEGVANQCESNGVDEEDFLQWCREEGLDPGEEEHVFDFWLAHGMDGF